MSFPSLRIALTLALVMVLAAPVSGQRSDMSSIIEAWLAGPHGDYDASAFTHWNEDGAVPQACAACHSESGMLDWLGADGTRAGVVDHPGTINTVIGCASCHVTDAHALDAVTLSSGATISALGANATCTMCHAGRSHGGDVGGVTEDLDIDAVSPHLSFINVHSGIAAAVMQGADGGVGFHYDGQRYAGRFMHVPSANSCIACHDAHSTEVRTEMRTACHQGVPDIAAIRTQHADFDGDGSNNGGIRDEILGLRALLDMAMRRYAQEVIGTPIGYSEDRYPYFFADANGDGRIDESEAIYPNRYAHWTPRLLMAAYNYQVVTKDAGIWVHNPRYALQLLHDSVVSLSERVQLETDGLVRP